MVDTADVAETKAATGRQAKHLLDHPLLVRTVDEFRRHQEQRCIDRAVYDPEASRLAAIEAHIAKHLLQRLREYVSTGQIAEVTLESIKARENAPVRNVRGHRKR